MAICSIDGNTATIFSTSPKLYWQKWWKQYTKQDWCKKTEASYLWDERSVFTPKLPILAAGKLLGSTESKNKRQKWRKLSKVKSCESCF